MAPPPVPRPAATVVLVRPGPSGFEVLLTQRPSTMAFAPDVHVFPGGAVDAGDSATELVARSPLSPAEAAERLGGGILGSAALALHMAAIRELFEEAGILLAKPLGDTPAAAELEAARASLLRGDSSLGDLCSAFDLRPRPDQLAPLSRWVTPRVVPRRFDTWFFAAELPPDAEPSFAPTEVVDHAWLAPAAALHARSIGEIGLWVPTGATLQQLEHAASFDDIARRLKPGPVGAMSVMDERPGLARLELPAAGGVSGQAVNCYLVGHREVLVVDPGDPSPDVLESLEALAGERSLLLRGVALTHADPDHHAGAEAIAMTHEIPIFAGPGAATALPYEIVELADGDSVPVGDVELRVVDTPGHRRDHVAFASADGWLLAGDLVGPGPRRSILGSPDPVAWRASLDLVEAISPGDLFPGHGRPPGDPRAAIAEARRLLLDPAQS